MTDSLKLAEMQRTSIEFERQRHLANWFIKSSPHMPQPQQQQQQQKPQQHQQQQATLSSSSSTSAAQAITTNTTAVVVSTTTAKAKTTAAATTANTSTTNSGNEQTSGGGTGHCSAVNNNSTQHPSTKHSNNSNNSSANPVFFLMSSNGNTGAVRHHNVGTSAMNHHHLNGVEGRKPKLRRFNSHDTSSNMFSVADFENARLARRNEIEMKQRLQRRMRMSANGSYGNGNHGNCGDYSTGDSKLSRYSNESQTEPLPAEIFLDRYSLPRVVRISYKTKFSDETLQSSSSNGSSTSTTNSSASGTNNGLNTVVSSSSGTTAGTNTGTTSSTASSNGNNQNVSTSNNTNNSSFKNGKVPNPTNDKQTNGELFLLYRLVKNRIIYHVHNAKSSTSNRKKGFLIPQEFPGYFSLVNEKGLPTATLYTSLIQLVRERVYKFVSVDNMSAFTESQPNTNSPPHEGCLPLYTPSNNQNRPQYVKTTARGGQVYRLLAVFEDGKQDHNAIGGSSTSNIGKQSSNHGREKEKGRYAQLLNENRQVLYVSLATKGKFYEIEPGVPQILQKLNNSGFDPNKKINPDCVYRITALVQPNKELPMTLRYISGPSALANSIPDNICISKISSENVVVACPIDDFEVQTPLQLRKLYLTKEMNLLKYSLGFESEQRMFLNPNVQNILKFCQFNCDQFLRTVEIEILNRNERSGSKGRVEGLKILKPLHLPKLLRREKTTIPAHEKEDSIIFLSKNDLQQLENKDNGNGNSENRISDKMKVFQSTKKKWFRKQDKPAAVNAPINSADLDAQAKRMSMERYTDMSKLLQERFGEKQNAANNQQEESISEPSGNSEIGFSDTETTTLATIEEKSNLKMIPNDQQPIQKSMSLQDIELMSSNARKPDLLPQNADAISEAGTDFEDIENRSQLQQSFITEKLYNEFHVKTKQYSKSSSSLQQLINFSLPQKLQLHDKQNKIKSSTNKSKEKCIDFNVGEPVTGRRAAGGLPLIAGANSMNSNGGVGAGGNGAGYSGFDQNHSMLIPLSPTSFIEDDLPYSSVRDSLIISNEDMDGFEPPIGNMREALNFIDYTKENIYAEICHEASAMGGIPSSRTKDTFSTQTHSTQISPDEYGDYACLSFPNKPSNSSGSSSIANGKNYMKTRNGGMHIGQAISRVKINCPIASTSSGAAAAAAVATATASPISYHTIYFGDEPLGERHEQKRRSTSTPLSKTASTTATSRNRSNNVTTLSLEGSQFGATNPNDFTEESSSDNIYNTLK